MAVGIIGAMEEEVVNLVHRMKNKREIKKFNMHFFTGKIGEKEVIVVRSGIGKVNAAMCTAILIECFKPEFLINVGVAGGLFGELSPGDVVIGSDLIQYDVDASCFGYEIGQVPNLNKKFYCNKYLVEKTLKVTSFIQDLKCIKGTIVTGDKFVNSKEDAEYLLNEFNGYACEMEGAAIAQVCTLAETPFIVIRSISDNANTGAQMVYENFKEIAIKNSMIIIEELLKNY